MPDIYDAEIARLTEAYKTDKKAIVYSWSNAEPLFRFLSPDGHCLSGVVRYGCPTMIRGSSPDHPKVALTEELTESVRNDARLPAESYDLRPEHLPACAEHQRAADAAGRVMAEVQS